MGSIVEAYRCRASEDGLNGDKVSREGALTCVWRASECIFDRMEVLTISERRGELAMCLDKARGAPLLNIIVNVPAEL